jgi:hypothetical protein
MIGSFAPLSLMECCASETASFLALLEKHLTENPVTDGTLTLQSRTKAGSVPSLTRFSSITRTAAQRNSTIGSALSCGGTCLFQITALARSSSSDFVKRLDGINVRGAPKRNRR